MAIPTKFLALQDQWNFHFIIQTLRWNKTTANDFLTTLNAYQLRTGFVTHVFLSTTQNLKYAGIGLIPHLRERLKALKGELHIERAWTPQLQRQNDASIMEQFHTICTSQTQLNIANNCILWLRVITISDLADISGRTIPFDRLNGKWRANADNNRIFPNCPTPLNKHFTIFRRLIRHAFCTKISPNTRQSYALDTILGQWFICERNIKYQCYAVHEGYVWRENDHWYAMESNDAPGGNYIIDRSRTIPVQYESHPVSCRVNIESGIDVWTPYSPCHTSPIDSTQQIILEDNF